MRTNRDIAIVGGTWLAVAGTAWLLIDHVPWPILFPLAGLVWFIGPLALTRFPTRPLLIACTVTMILAISPFLFLLWTASMFLQLLIGFNPFPYVLLETLLVLPGALVGAIVGLLVRGHHLAPSAD